MKESFLYYLWENRLVIGPLLTNGKQSVEIINPGHRNTDSGPDYLEAKIKIGEQLWAGHVEIHVKSSDWNRHGHQHDKAYRNVVLHVVYEHDADVNRIPVLELKGHFDEGRYLQYQQFITSKHWIACERSLARVQPFVKLSWMERLALERLEDKTGYVSRIAMANQYDWENVLYKMMMRYFGLKVNNEAFECLAAILPFKSLLKHADNLLQVESMLLGCAGLLSDDFTEHYPLLLQREFKAMRAKFNLLTMPKERWRFMRMRPINFPTVRLAQLAQMIHLHGCMFSKIKEATSISEVKALFEVKASEYWDTHYKFETESDFFPKHLGDSTTDVLIINAVIPMLFCYGRLHKEQSYCEKALRFLEQLSPENNTVVRQFAARGMKPGNAMQSQGVLQSYSMYCKRKRCLECSIGNVILH